MKKLVSLIKKIKIRQISNSVWYVILLGFFIFFILFFNQIRIGFLLGKLDYLKTRYERLEKKQEKIHNKAEQIRMKLKNIKGTVKASTIYYENDIEKLIENSKKLNVDRKIVIYLAGRCIKEGKNDEMIAKCFKFGLGISNAESSIFKKAYFNNGFGLMKNGKIIKFNSKYESIDYWVDRFYKYWYNHNSPEDFLNKSKYCVSGCSNWNRNVRYVLDILNNR